VTGWGLMAGRFSVDAGAGVSMGRASGWIGLDVDFYPIVVARTR
jgi:murein endopeptidase